MPIYEYRCSSCGHELEALQKLSEAPLLKCPACAADALVKKLSAAGFQLKGSGWYATDFKGSGGKPAPKAEGADSKAESKAADGSEAKSESKGSGSGESKAEAKSEAKADAKSATTAPASGTGAPPASS